MNMPQDIEYDELENGRGFWAHRGDMQIGEINIAIVGANRLIIESTRVDSEYDNTDVCKNLVRCVVELARAGGRKILCLCPRAQSVFNHCPEFDDVRLIQMAR